MVFILVALGTVSVQAADRYVALTNSSPASPYSDWSTAATNIQTAVNVAVAGDTVWVGSGRYTAWTNSVNDGGATNVVRLYGKAITLRSFSGNPADTIIDGEGKNRCVYIVSTNRTATPYVLDGFTITNGFAAGAGTGSGGVRIYNDNGLMKEAAVQNCVITDNRVSDGSGKGNGGLYSGWAQIVGGGDASHIVISNCVVRNNSTNGICINSYATNVNDSTLIVDCRVQNNRGSGISLLGGNRSVVHTIQNCIITDNVTPDSGGGISAYGGSPVDIYNCLIARNGCYSDYDSVNPPGSTAYSGGGGVYLDQGTATNRIVSCTIVSNWAGGRGFAGVMGHWNSQYTWIQFCNTIVYSNWNAFYGQNNLGGGAVKSYTNCLAPGITGPGSMATPAPVFENIARGDYRLTRYSSGVDAGLVEGWMSSAKDMNGQPRVSGNGLVDMGAFETEVGLHPGHYVAQAGQTPLYPYTNWTMAASNIQEAVDIYNRDYPTTIWVGPGRYTAGSNAKVYASTTSVVSIYNKPMTLRASSANPADTIIDGEGTNRCVFFGPALLSTPIAPYVLDGFTITNGYAAGNNTMRCGGVYIWNEDATPVWTAQVQNCVITDSRSVDNAPDGRGKAGGIFVGWVVNTPQAFALVVSNCVIRNCSTNGLFMSSYSSNQASRCILTDCLIENNMGSGFAISGGSFTNTVIQNCTFRGNVTYDLGGGLLLGRRGDVVNCLFYNNSRLAPPSEVGNNYAGGGALYIYSCPTGYIVNCTIVSNFTATGGRALCTGNTAQNIVLNTIVYNNRDTVYADGNAIFYGAVVISNSLSTGWSGSGNLSFPPPVFENIAAGDWRLKNYSSGVDAGQVQGWMSGARDLAGQPRVSGNGLVDMGAYETTYAPHPGYYVAHSGQTPVAPYTNLTMAASNIQDAVSTVDPIYATNVPLTVWVGPGTYTLPPSPTVYAGTNIVYIDRPLILRSSSGNPADTILDGQGTYRGIAMVYGIAGKEIVVDGLTISNCYGYTLGGGILIHDPLIGYMAPGWTGRVQNCIIVTNTVAYGPAFAGGVPAAGAVGGGIGFSTKSASYFVMTNCVVSGNFATNGIDGINAGGLGGGIYHGAYAPGVTRINRCQLRDNKAYRGGNAFLTGATLTFENCVVSGGRVGYSGSQAFGGGLFLGASSTLRNSLFYDNNDWGGRGSAINGEIQGSNSYLDVESCTLAGNLSGGSAVFLRPYGSVNGFSASLHLVNSIVYSNAASILIGVGVEGPPNNYSTYVSNSCVGATNVNVMYGPTNLLYYLGLSANTTTNNPRFVSVAGNDYRVAFNSPCINAGVYVPWMDGAVDADGKPRISPIKNGVVDIGVYEFPIQIGSVFNLR
jgi:hypothetical protein